VATGRDASQNKYSEQNVLNSSYDKDYDILAVETVSFNPVTSTMERTTGIQGNGTLTLGYDASSNLTTLTKVVGGVTYTKTLTWTDGNLTNISVWS